MAMGAAFVAKAQNKIPDMKSPDMVDPNNTPYYEDCKCGVFNIDHLKNNKNGDSTSTVFTAINKRNGARIFITNLVDCRKQPIYGQDFYNCVQIEEAYKKNFNNASNKGDVEKIINGLPVSAPQNNKGNTKPSGMPAGSNAGGGSDSAYMWQDRYRFFGPMEYWGPR